MTRAVVLNLPILLSFNTVPHVMVIPSHKILSIGPS